MHLIYWTLLEYHSQIMKTIFQVLLAVLAFYMICCHALRLDQVVRPGCTVGIIEEDLDKTGPVGKLLEVDSFDHVVYPTGEAAQKNQVNKDLIVLLFSRSDRL